MIPEIREIDEAETAGPARRLYSMREAAEQLGGITERMLFTLVMRGDVKSVRVGRRRFISAGALDIYVAQLEETAAAA